MRLLPLESYLVATFLMLATPALGEDAWQPQVASHLAGTHGLTGFGSMVDGRIPSPFMGEPQTETGVGTFSTRFGLHYAFQARRRELQGSRGKYAIRDNEHSLRAQYGLAVQGVDLTLGVPYRHEVRQIDVRGGPADTTRQRGLGDVTLGAKLAFRVPRFFLQDWAIAAFGPYVLARVPSGADRLSRPLQAEYGLALAGPYGGGFRYHANLALLQEEGGLMAVVARIGFSVVPIADADTALRLYLNFDGIEHEGAPHTTIDVEAGGQLLLLGFLTVDLGFSFRALDAGFSEGKLRRAVKNQLGDDVRRSHDEGTFTLTFGLGVIL